MGRRLPKTRIRVQLPHFWPLKMARGSPSPLGLPLKPSCPSTRWEKILKAWGPHLAGVWWEGFWVCIPSTNPLRSGVFFL